MKKLSNATGHEIDVTEDTDRQLRSMSRWLLRLVSVMLALSAAVREPSVEAVQVQSQTVQQLLAQQQMAHQQRLTLSSQLSHFRKSLGSAQTNSSLHQLTAAFVASLANETGLGGLDLASQRRKFHEVVGDVFMRAATPVFLEMASQLQHSQKSLAPYDPSSGLSEPTADCRRLLTDWMAKCAFGPRTV